MKKFLLLLFLTFNFCAPIGAAIDADLHRQLNNAYDSFKDGQYYRAINIYETLINVEKVNNAFVFYNLSNSYYRIGDIANAVLNIERAARLRPRDSDIKNNRTFLLSQSGQNGDSFSETITGFFSLNEITIWTSIFFISLMLAISGFIIYKKPILKKVIRIILIIFILSLFLTALKSSVVLTKKAVVLTPSVLKSGPNDNSGDIYNLGAAQIVKIILETDNWTRINFSSPEGILDGWIENNRLGKI